MRIRMPGPPETDHPVQTVRVDAAADAATVVIAGVAYETPIGPDMPADAVRHLIGPGQPYAGGELLGAPAPAPIAPVLTPLGFQRLFTQAERIAIRAAGDPIVQDFMALSSIAQDVDLGDADVVAGVGYLEHLGLIGAGRAAVVLTGTAP